MGGDALEDGRGHQCAIEECGVCWLRRHIYTILVVREGCVCSFRDRNLMAHEIDHKTTDER